MTRHSALGLSAMLLAMSWTAGGAVADVKSGLELGASVPPFHVKDITGPNQGKTLCYR